MTTRGTHEIHEHDVLERDLLDDAELKIFEQMSPTAQRVTERAMRAPIWSHLRAEGLELVAPVGTWSVLARWSWRGEQVVLGVGLEQATLEGIEHTWIAVIQDGRLSTKMGLTSSSSRD